MKVIGYKLKREGCPGWMFMGVEPHEVAATLACELENHKGLSVDECDTLHVEAFETTTEEIDALPEFEGW